MVVAKAVKVVLDVKVTEDLDVTEVMKIVKVLEALNIVKTVEAVEVEETGRPGLSVQTAQLVQAEAAGAQAEAAAAAAGAPAELAAELMEGTARKERKRKKSRKARKDERLAAVTGPEQGAKQSLEAAPEEQPILKAEAEQRTESMQAQQAGLPVQIAEQAPLQAVQTATSAQTVKNSPVVQARDSRKPQPMNTLLAVKIIQDLQSLKGRDRMEEILGMQVTAQQLILAVQGRAEHQHQGSLKRRDRQAKMIIPVMEAVQSRRGSAAAQEREGTSKRIREFLAGAKGMEALRAPPQAAAVPLA
ncbi:hypothetical protein [Paenibacillus mucilaginosus]|nr:hypothetical protein [Paenibacillus mucilaginosus]MCG7217913.1 hypothetical protein [Paenibacillus mucilaginosus]